MQKLSNHSIIFFISLTMLFTSCSKDDEVGLDKPGLKVDIDGESYVASSLVANKYEGTDLIFINSENEERSRHVDLCISSDISEGTHSMGGLNTGEFSIYTYNTNEYDIIFICESGSMKILNHDTTNNSIKGTFEFMALIDGAGPDSVLLTNGNFLVRYTEWYE